jgi:uncharacterized protein (TIGR03435 family)
MMRSMTAAALILFLCGAVSGQTPAAPSFEVASIKPTEPSPDGMMRIGMGGDPGRVNYTNVSLREVLQRAYGVKRPQINGPSWLDTDRFNIVAKIPEGVSNEQVPAMLQNLIVERFKLSVRRETKEMPVYALVVGKNGPKLEKADDEAPEPAPRAIEKEVRPGGPKGGGLMMIANGHLEAKKLTLSRFSDMLSNMMDRPVLDQTDLKGMYNFTLDIAMEDLFLMKGAIRHPDGPGAPGGEGPGGPRTEGPAPEGAPGQSIFTSIQKLGLKLEPRKAPLDFIIVEKGDRVPTEN